MLIDILIEMIKKSLFYYSTAVNDRSKLALHGEVVAGKAYLLCLYCAEQRNSGIILNCKNWTDRQWMMLVGVETMPTNLPDFWHWEDENLIVDVYNLEAEKKADHISKLNKERAEKRWSNRQDADNKSVSDNADRTTDCNAVGNAVALPLELPLAMPTALPTAMPSGMPSKEKRREVLKEKNNINVIPKEKMTLRDFQKLTTQEIGEVMANVKDSSGNVLPLNEQEIMEQSLKMKEFYDENGWIQGKNKPIKSWKMTASRWIRLYFERKHGKNGFENSNRCNYPQRRFGSHVRKDTDDLGAF